MEKIKVLLEKKGYSIYISDSYKNFNECLPEEKNKRSFVIITDTNVKKYQLSDFYKILQNKIEKIYIYVIEAGEESKKLSTIENIYSFLYEHNICRNDVIIALGGGVVGDITGYVASTYMRGITFIQVPTTLLAQVDSSMGGKTGVNFKNIKNAVGTFYQPKFIYTNLSAIDTLPTREYLCGLSEMIIHCIIKNNSLFEFIESNIQAIKSRNKDILQYLIKENCKIKIEIIEKDAFDFGIRKILNFGHTFGHGIEGVYLDKLYHGECVAIGSICAFYMAEEIGLINSFDRKRLELLFKNLGLPSSLKKLDVDSVYTYMLHDKKNNNGEFTFILPEKIGKVVEYKTNDIELIKKVLRKINY